MEPLWKVNARSVLHNGGPKVCASYLEGVAHGVDLFAWWKDGEKMVGTCGCKKAEVFEEIRAFGLSLGVFEEEDCS